MIWRRARSASPLARRNRRIDRGQREERRKRVRITMRVAASVAVLGLVVWHGVRLADSRDWLDLLKVREVRVIGVEVAHPNVLVAEAGLMGADIHYWSGLGQYAERAERDPLVHSARLVRRFPNRLALEVVERRPVALIALDRLTPADSAGRVLPVDPFHAGWDVPVLTGPWTSASVVEAGRVRPGAVRRTLAWLGEVERKYPVLAREISTIELDRRGTVTLRLVHSEGAVVLAHDTPIEKLALIDDVLRDLHEKEIPYTVLDFRFEDQIVVRKG
ncbi:MAG TPA: FtsQ-type POTRA domain-containing protein [Gemmatimonadota bacterium]|nr:FtsQ-type POTRA domain-containing protein [Gemmatimonadota bacterium]